MKTKNLLKISLLLFVIAEFLLSSCSVIGLGIGAAIDGSKPKSKMVSIGANEVNKINNKRNITIHKKDSMQLHGKYTGISQVSQQDYAVEYKKFKEQNKEYQFLPELGDSIPAHLVFGIEKHLTVYSSCMQHSFRSRVCIICAIF